MKARISPKNALPKRVLKACEEYAESVQKANNIRFLKCACYVLNKDFGFGKERLERFILSANDLAVQKQYDEVFWEHMDREMKRLKMDFPDEEYEDIIGEWKRKNNMQEET